MLPHLYLNRVTVIGVLLDVFINTGFKYVSILDEEGIGMGFISQGEDREAVWGIMNSSSFED